MEIIAYHGWGFDRTCWKDWQLFFQDRGDRFVAFDRGYFSQPDRPEFLKTESIKVLFTHSYGLHWCPIQHLEQAHMLVIFNGFQTLHPTEGKPQRYSQRVLKQMIQQCTKDPKQVLREFYQNTYDPIPVPESLKSELDQKLPNLQQDLLVQDLQALDHCCLEFDVDLNLKNLRRLVRLQGTVDRIVPVSQKQKIALPVEGEILLNLIPDAGHALPFSHFRHCWNALEPLFSLLPVARMVNVPK